MVRFFFMRRPAYVSQKDDIGRIGKDEAGKLLRNRWKISIVLLCLGLCLGLWLGMGIWTEDSEETVPVYEDGEVVGFIGDSITHVTYSDHGYMELLEQYYLSRFPERQIEFRNIGAGGYKTSDVLNIYDMDPAFRGLDRAVIMLGTNEAILGISSEEYIGNMEQLIERLKQDGLAGEDILILSPPIFDEEWSLGFGLPYENRVLEYMGKLEAGAREWGVGYLDFHTLMFRITEEIQKEDIYNSLTTDGIHPDAVGHRLIAFFILQAQGFGGEPLSEIRIPQNGQPDCSRDEIIDFYRSEKGMYGVLYLQTLPSTDQDERSAFRNLLEEADILYSKRLQVEGLAPEKSYQIFIGEAALGEFTGEALAEGIDMTVLEGYPQQETMKKIADLGRERHQRSASLREMWVDILMQEASYTPEQAQEAYDNWRSGDEQLRSEMYAMAENTAEDAYELVVVEKGYSILELKQERLQDQEQIRREWQDLSVRLQRKVMETVASLQDGMLRFIHWMEVFSFGGKESR